jgi:hypothetical protein
MQWRFSLRHPSIAANAWQLVKEPIGWDSAEIRIVRDREFHGIDIAYSLPVKFYGGGFGLIKQVYDANGIDAAIECQVEHRTPDGAFAVVFTGRLNLGGATFRSEDGLLLADVNLEQTGNAQTLRSFLESKVDLRSRISLANFGSSVPDLPAYTRADYDLTLLPQALISRFATRYAGASPFVYPSVTVGGFFSGFRWLYDPIHLPTTEELGQGHPLVLPYIANGSPAFPISSRTPLFRIPLAAPTLELRLQMQFRVRLTVANLGDTFNFLPMVKFMADPSDATNSTTDVVVWSGAPVDVISATQFVYEYTYTINTVYNTPAVNSLDYIYLNFGFGDSGPPFFFPTGFPDGMQVEVFLDSFSADFRELQVSPPTTIKATLVNEALARITESITDRKVTARSDLFGRTASQPLPAPSGANGIGHNIALTSGLQLRRLNTRSTGNNTPVPTPAFTSLRELLRNLNATYNIGYGLEPVPTGATLPSQLVGNTEQLLRVEQKRHFYQLWPVLKELVAIREYELKPSEADAYNRVEIGFDTYETESLNGLEEFNTKWEYQGSLKHYDNALSIRCTYVAGGYLIEKTRRIDPQENASTDVDTDEKMFFICVAKSSGTHAVDGQPYTPLNTSERAENMTASPFAANGNLIDGQRAYNLRIAPQRNLQRWADILFMEDSQQQYTLTEFAGNRYEWWRLDEAGQPLQQDIGGRRLISPGNTTQYLRNLELRCQYPCSWGDYVRIQANPYGPVRVTDSGMADGFWYIREVAYEPAQGMARWTLIQARDRECLGVEPVVRIVFADLPIVINMDTPGSDISKFFSLETECCDVEPVITLVEGPDPELVDTVFDATPPYNPLIQIEFSPKVTIEEDIPFTLKLAVDACQSKVYEFPGILLKSNFLFLNAWAFDRVNDHVVIPHAASLNPTGDMSWSFWLRRTVAFGSQPMMPISKFASNTPGRWFIEVTGSDELRMLQYSSAGGNRSMTTPISMLPLNQWVHFVVIKRATLGTSQIWRNGVNLGLTLTGGDWSTDGFAGTDALNLGRFERDNARFWGGDMDEMNIFNKGVSPAEIAHLYNLGSGNLPPTSALANLVARYSFNTAPASGGNFVLVDDSGNGNNGLSSGIAVSPLIAH